MTLFSWKAEHILRITADTDLNVNQNTATFLRNQVNHFTSASKTAATRSQIGQAVLLLLFDDVQ